MVMSVKFFWARFLRSAQIFQSTVETLPYSQFHSKRHSQMFVGIMPIQFDVEDLCAGSNKYGLSKNGPLH